MIDKNLLENTLILDFLNETSSYYVNKNKIKSWSEKASKNYGKAVTRIKIKSKQVMPHLTDLQTKKLIEIVGLMTEKEYERITSEINCLDTTSREVFFSVMNEI